MCSTSRPWVTCLTTTTLAAWDPSSLFMAMAPCETCYTSISSWSDRTQDFKNFRLTPQFRFEHSITDLEDTTNFWFFSLSCLWPWLQPNRFGMRSEIWHQSFLFFFNLFIDFWELAFCTNCAGVEFGYGRFWCRRDPELLIWLLFEPDIMYHRSIIIPTIFGISYIILLCHYNPSWVKFFGEFWWNDRTWPIGLIKWRVKRREEGCNLHRSGRVRRRTQT